MKDSDQLLPSKNSPQKKKLLNWQTIQSMDYQAASGRLTSPRRNAVSLKCAWVPFGLMTLIYISRVRHGEDSNNQVLGANLEKLDWKSTQKQNIFSKI